MKRFVDHTIASRLLDLDPQIPWVIYLVCVNLTTNTDKYYRVIPGNNVSFFVRYGRRGSTGQTHTYRSWEIMSRQLQKKLQKGYVYHGETTHSFTEALGISHVRRLYLGGRLDCIVDPSQRRLVSELL